MLSKEFLPVANQLAERAVIRAEAADAWVVLALKQPDPEKWVDALVAAALNRLETVRERLGAKVEARAELLEIQRALRAGIADSRKDLPTLKQKRTDDPPIARERAG